MPNPITPKNSSSPQPTPTGKQEKQQVDYVSQPSGGAEPPKPPAPPAAPTTPSNPSPSKNKNLALIIIGVLILIAGAAVVYGVQRSWTKLQPGQQPTPSQQASSFQYFLGGTFTKDVTQLQKQELQKKLSQSFGIQTIAILESFPEQFRIPTQKGMPLDKCRSIEEFLQGISYIDFISDCKEFSVNLDSNETDQSNQQTGIKTETQNRREEQTFYKVLYYLREKESESWQKGYQEIFYRYKIYSLSTDDHEPKTIFTFSPKVNAGSVIEKINENLIGIYRFSSMNDTKIIDIEGKEVLTSKIPPSFNPAFSTFSTDRSRIAYVSGIKTISVYDVPSDKIKKFKVDISIPGEIGIGSFVDNNHIEVGWGDVLARFLGLLEINFGKGSSKLVDSRNFGALSDDYRYLTKSLLLHFKTKEIAEQDLGKIIPRPSELYLIDLKANKKSLILSSDTLRFSPLISNDKKLLVLPTIENKLIVINFNKPEEPRIQEFELLGVPQTVFLSQDGKRVAYRFKDAKLAILNLENGENISLGVIQDFLRDKEDKWIEARVIGIFSTKKADIEDTSDWQTYRNEEYGFEVSYPEGYTTQEIPFGQPSGLSISLNKGNILVQKIDNSPEDCVFSSVASEERNGLSFIEKKETSEIGFYYYRNYPKYVGGYCGMSSGCSYQDIYRIFYNGNCYQIMYRRSDREFMEGDPYKNPEITGDVKEVPGVFNQILSTFRFIN